MDETAKSQSRPRIPALNVDGENLFEPEIVSYTLGTPIIRSVSLGVDVTF